MIEFSQRNDMYLVDGVGEICMNLESIHVTYNKERRVLQGDCITLELGKCRRQIFVLTLIFPSKAVSPPDIRPSFSTANFSRSALKTKPFTVRIYQGGSRFI
ncbi:hypothetical protein WK94_27110 [Burkholderia ubonensis]|nr:hypothetical protein WK94_27110 [Burkholderia ubonensis]KWK93747.1 hypothetical protein WM19_21070 [Burkholderia ubonensis]KWN28140.1 hypothetical protein WM22_28695 [Burkholderia ubonensis]